MYYVGESDLAAWEASADNGIISEEFQALIDENSKSITYNDDVINMINFN